MFLFGCYEREDRERSLCVSRDVSKIALLEKGQELFALREQGCFREHKKVSIRVLVRSA